MAAKSRAGKLENTIEQCRNEGKWQKSIELAEELKSSSSSHGRSIFRVVSVFFTRNVLKFQKHFRTFSSARASSRVIWKRTRRLRPISGDRRLAWRNPGDF